MEFCLALALALAALQLRLRLCCASSDLFKLIHTYILTLHYVTYPHTHSPTYVCMYVAEGAALRCDANSDANDLSNDAVIARAALRHAAPRVAVVLRPPALVFSTLLLAFSLCMY